MGIKPVKVSQLNEYIKRILMTDPLLGNVSVIGEISNLKYHSSGHVYFSLKDDGSRVNCFLSRSTLPNIRYELEEGMEITAAGHMSVYSPGGYYSLNVRDVEVSGQGDLAVAFEKLKNKLAAEGLFSEDHKKIIPAYPSKIVIVTAETGAAVQDMLKIMTGRNKMTDIVIYPVTVQGKNAAGEISAAIDDINISIPDADTIITGRGGGSAEDLWAFNEEAVARAIYRSRIPVISAVGHETDFTISDMVADRRAETPTAAAVMAVPDTEVIKENMKAIKDSMLDTLESVYREKTNTLKNLDLDIFGQMIESRLKYSRLKTDKLKSSIDSLLDSVISDGHNRIILAKARIDGASPDSILKRGYTAVTDSDGNFVRDLSRLQPEDMINILGHDAVAAAKVEEVNRK
ncbi:MAG: exodeoxyribonuclease VII large subunit [Eubacteriaceae bacterium]|nr:exodeoxyribonuclease VII large subunit [Eubacteriaceae bacterium]